MSEVTSRGQSDDVASSLAAVPPMPTPDVVDRTQWVDAAQVALTSVHQQLDEFDQADSRLQPSLAMDQSGEAARLRQEFNARRSRLQWQAAVLEAGLWSAEHLRPTERTLEGVRQ